MRTLLALAVALCAVSSFAQCCKSAAGGCGEKPVSLEVTGCAKDDAFLAEAQKMMAASEGKAMCCKSTAEKPMAKGDKGCCNAKGEAAKFKVFVRGEGYRFFGCQGSASKGRKDLVASGKVAGRVQAVTGTVAL